MRRLTVLAMAAVFLATAAAQATTYSLDPAHSSITFRVKHIIGKVVGHFDKFKGGFNYDETKKQGGMVEATIESTSIDTGIEKRDNHLRSAEFLDVQKFPTLTFKSTGMADLTAGKGTLPGELTIHGVTKPVTLNVEFAGTTKDPFDKTGKAQRAGATATTTINRLDYGVGPASGPMSAAIGNNVEITLEVEAVSQ